MRGCGLSWGPGSTTHLLLVRGRADRLRRGRGVGWEPEIAHGGGVGAKAWAGRAARLSGGIRKGLRPACDSSDMCATITSSMRAGYGAAACGTSRNNLLGRAGARANCGTPVTPPGALPARNQRALTYGNPREWHKPARGCVRLTGSVASNASRGRDDDRATPLTGMDPGRGAPGPMPRERAWHTEAALSTAARHGCSGRSQPIRRGRALG
jgi:hypothetical protein